MGSEMCIRDSYMDKAYSGFRKFPDGGVSPRVCAVLCCPVCFCAVMCVGNFPICLFCFWLRLKEWIRRMCV